MSGTAIPYIDPNVEYAGVSRLRKLNSGQLEKLEKTLVLQDKDNPLAVLVRYEQCLMMQEQLRKLENTIELLTNGEEVAGLIEGLRALEHGRTRSIKAIRASLQKKTIPAGPSVHPSRKGVQRKGDTLLDRCTAGVIHRQVCHHHSPTLPTADGRRRSAGTFSKLPL